MLNTWASEKLEGREPEVHGVVEERSYQVILVQMAATATG